jgi:hypothetical protein
VERFKVNVGTISTVPMPVSIPLPVRKACRRSMPSRWGGGVVVVRGREIRPHGEGPQRARRITAERGGRR